MAGDVSIQFRGVDAGASQVIKKLRQESSQYVNEAVRDHQKSATSSKKVVDLLNMEIDALERKIKLNQQLSRMEGGPRGGISGAGAGTDKDMMQVQLLRELVAQTKDAAKKQIAEGKVSKEFLERDFRRMGPEEALRHGFISEEMGDPSAKRGGSKGLMKGAAIAAGLAIANKIASVIGSSMQIDANARTYSEAFIQKREMLWGMVPILGHIMKGYLAEEGRSLRETWRHQRAQLGATALGVTSTGGGSSMRVSRLNEMGFTAGTRLNVMTEIARRGFTGSGIGDEATDILAAGRAYGIDQSTLLNIARTGGVGGGGASRGLLQIMRGAKSDAAVGVGVQTLAALTQQMSTKLTEVPDKLGDVVSAFQRVGGSFGDTRAGGVLSRMNMAIQSPADEYNKAFLYNALARTRPGASWGELMMMQEEGISNLGVVNALMSQTQQVHGFGDVGRLHLSKMLGLSLSEAEQLMTAFEKDGEIRATSINKSTRETLRTRGIRLTSQEDREQAQIQDSFVRGLGISEIRPEEIVRAIRAIKSEGLTVPVDVVSSSPMQEMETQEQVKKLQSGVEGKVTPLDQGTFNEFFSGSK